MSQVTARLIRKLQPDIDWVAPEHPFQPLDKHDPNWTDFLRVHNGLSAFKGGLRIFGTGSSLLPGVEEWNRGDLWRCEYHGLDEGLFFFAEDIFGNQFGFDSHGKVLRFLAETGDREPCGENFEGWLQILLADPTEELSLWLLDDWLRENPKPKLSEHLCPKVPFVAKGPTECGNLYACDRLESMRFKGSFAHQIRDIPTGGQIQIRVK
jgi:hypothetical protein